MMDEPSMWVCPFLLHDCVGLKVTAALSCSCCPELLLPRRHACADDGSKAAHAASFFELLLLFGTKGSSDLVLCLPTSFSVNYLFSWSSY